MWHVDCMFKMGCHFEMNHAATTGGTCAEMCSRYLLSGGGRQYLIWPNLFPHKGPWNREPSWTLTRFHRREMGVNDRSIPRIRSRQPNCCIVTLNYPRLLIWFSEKLSCVTGQKRKQVGGRTPVDACHTFREKTIWDFSCAATVRMYGAP